MNHLRVLGHKEWANEGRKSDPRYSMDWRRNEVAEFVSRTTNRVLGSRVLALGTSGPDVEELQLLLNIVPADGAFGPKTEANVKLFQRLAGLTPDGVVGDVTLAALNKSRPDIKPPIEPAEESAMFVVDEPGTGRQFLCDTHTKRWIKTMDELRGYVNTLGLLHLTEKPETVIVRTALLNARTEVTT